MGQEDYEKVLAIADRIDTELSERYVALACLGGYFVPCAARFYRHQQPDTWERIIEDARYHDTDFEKLVARCKALCERTREDA